MTSFIIRRLFLGIIVLLVATVLVFVMMHVLPGDPLLLYLGEQYLSYEPEAAGRDQAREGLDKPVIAAVLRLARGRDQGGSGRVHLTYQTPVTTMIKQTGCR